MTGSRISDPATAEDLTQEALERLVAVEDRLDSAALAPYAVVPARNAVRGWARRRERELRHGPRMLDLGQPPDPQERALQEEERRAVALALGRLPPGEREPLIAHDVEGLETRVLADRLGTTPGGGGGEAGPGPATGRVPVGTAAGGAADRSLQAVLLALSAGDTRQQRASGAAEHLLACPPCAALGDPLMLRRHPLAVLWPFLGMDHLVRWLRRWAKEHPAPTVAAGVTVAVLAVWAAIVLGGREPPQLTLFVQADSSISLSGSEPMAPYAGMTVKAPGVPVQSVVEPRGFWVGDSRAERVWVDVHDETEPPKVAAGQRITFEGTLVPNTLSTMEPGGRRWRRRPGSARTGGVSRRRVGRNHSSRSGG